VTILVPAGFAAHDRKSYHASAEVCPFRAHTSQVAVKFEQGMSSIMASETEPSLMGTACGRSLANRGGLATCRARLALASFTGEHR
jgi:hypothetical protein